MVSTNKFVSTQFEVDAVQVDPSNMQAVAEWCGGTIKVDDGKNYIKVDVKTPINDRQSMAFVGMWVLKKGEGFKVYTPKAFERSFQPVSARANVFDSSDGESGGAGAKYIAGHVPRSPMNPGGTAGPAY